MPSGGSPAREKTAASWRPSRQLTRCPQHRLAHPDSVLLGCRDEGRGLPDNVDDTFVAYAAFMRLSCCSAVTPSSRPTSSAILPLATRSTVIPPNFILRPDASGNDPARKSSKVAPVCVPPPAQRPDHRCRLRDQIGRAGEIQIGERIPKVGHEGFDIGTRRGACSEYCRSMSGAASSPTTSDPVIAPKLLEPLTDDRLVVLFLDMMPSLWRVDRYGSRRPRGSLSS